MRRIYDPDHTADIRLLLRKLVIRGVIGLVLVNIFAVFPMFVLDDSREAATESDLIVWILRIAWIFIALLFVVSMVSLASAGIGWIAYRRRRAELDAAGAEAVGEVRARLAYLPSDDDPKS
ncbi:hypothetical protein JNW91_00570 [Micromonospora sp. STR1_7]|uniref:DUF4229 domain-containing protein n=1 Tax=Micromonospora parastrephiae TaxID=2806101 RepID=A0ABS1XMJ9_9ACTN|nr:hypothetical protein [Micromonospora parastrephiae]MBM0230495.1 hypothetical protein [Micromonospora parastrephiae]